MRNVFPLHTFVYKYNYNRISYLTQICWIENRIPSVGLRPPLVISYGIPSGADTIHSAMFHESKFTLYCTWNVHQKTTVRNCIIESVWNIFGYGEGSLFMGRLDCRFITSVFIVKRWSKTSDYLTRNNLDLSTPPFYSLKRRKKAGFRTQSHITDNKNTCTYTPRHSREYGTTNGNVRWMCIQFIFNVHSMHI